MELDILWMCRRWDCLPEHGGYLDQDAVLMERMELLEVVYLLMKKWHAMEIKDVSQFSDAEKKLLLWLYQQEVEF
jgi:hypothetical protein